MAAALGAPAASAVEPTPPPSVFHEILIGGEMGTPGTSRLSGTCDTTKDSTFHFTATGGAFGPYPGTFVEKGTFTIGPPSPPSPTGSVVILVTSFKARFRIESPNGIVTGTKTMAPSTVNRGDCGPFVPPNGDPHAAEMRADVVYTAKVKSRDGRTACYSGTGWVQYGDTQTRGIPNFQGYAFSEPFLTSTASESCDGEGDESDGGADPANPD
jgi:hypothetical protein